MKILEKRDVEIKYCDECGKEIDHAEKCRVCGRDLCPNKCTAFSVEIYQYAEEYSDSKRFRGFVCKQCAHLVMPLVEAMGNSQPAVSGG